jgi:thioredoxin-related protein
MLHAILIFLFALYLPAEFLHAGTSPDSNSVGAAKSSLQQIEWLTWEQAMELHQKEPRKIVLDVYTDWCGWCKRMDQNTYNHPLIASYINTHYYAVKFNAERREDIVFRGKTYKYVSGGKRGYHEFAAKITQGRLSYPSTVFLDEQMEIIQSIPGYREPDEFEIILTYFARNQHLKTPWDAYQRSYTPLSKQP